MRGWPARRSGAWHEVASSESTGSGKRHADAAFSGGGMTTTATLPFVGRVRTDPIAALAVRMAPACRAAVDVDEVAALLEASGINDRVAVREYGAQTVFALATTVWARALDGTVVLDDEPVAPVRAPVRQTARALTDTAVRALLYLTPLAVGVGTASKVDGLPALPVTGTLIAGWGAGQALSYLGYRRLGDAGVTVATRLLGGGFLWLAAAWAGVLAFAGTPWPRGFAVAGMQLVFFAAVAVALVTANERRVLAAASLCWAAAAGVALDGGHLAEVGLAASLLVLLAVAYRPAFGGGGARTHSRWRSWRGDVAYALRYGAVGTGQAALLVAVGLTGVSLSSVWAAVPLLLGVPLIELTLVWHQRRIADARAVLDDRAQFDRRLGWVSAGTAAVLAVPVLGGGLLASAAWLGAAPTGAIRLAAAVLLVAVYALCLVLAAHRRAGTAATLVWWPALLVGFAGPQATGLQTLAPQFAETLTAATLLGAAAPGLVVAVQALRNPESYR
jgi:hypothetical protein